VASSSTESYEDRTRFNANEEMRETSIFMVPFD